MSTPLCTELTTLLATIVLREELHVGRSSINLVLIKRL
jgi:hypothetical protein